MKRTFDCVVSAGALIVLAPLLMFAAALVKLTSAGPIFFRQDRVGASFRRFRIYKFRSMVVDAPDNGAVITIGQDPRITPVGRILRAAKIDELPQLFNVLKGDMSFVGPRPEVPKYVEQFRRDYQEILQISPGITDLASIEYRDEATILALADDPENEYVQRVLPEKIRLAKDYVRRRSFWFDLRIIFMTLWRLCADGLTLAGTAAVRPSRAAEVARAPQRGPRPRHDVRGAAAWCVPGKEERSR